jgi:hypothetical protein
VNIKFPNGFYERVPVRVGDSLFDGLKNAHIPIGGFCGNTTPENFYSLRKKPVESTAYDLGCQECMCYIESPWFEKIPMHDIEKQAL